MSNQGEYPEDNRVGKHEPHDFSLTRRDLIKVSAATAATAVGYPHSTLVRISPLIRWPNLLCHYSERQNRAA